MAKKTAANTRTRTAPRTVRIGVGCNHTEGTTPQKLKLPLTVTTFDLAEVDETETGFVTWLSSQDGRWHLSTVGKVVDCQKEATLLANALRAYVKTPEGEQEALAFVRHRLGGK